MRSLRSSLLALATVVGGALSAQPALAVACGGDISATGTISGVVIDPFQPSTTSLNGTITINRTNVAGGGKTQTYSFYLVPHLTTLPSGSTITFGGTNILNNSNPLVASTPNSPLTTPQGNIAAFAGSPSGFLEVGFGGNSLNDTQTANVVFTLGSLGALAAGTQTVMFDTYFICKGTGGTSDVSTPTLGNGGVTITLTVMSALQASFVGTALDFGELGGSAPTTGAHASVIGGSGLRVASSGPYSVDVASANSYRLLMQGGSLSNASQTINYQLSFLGESPNHASPTFLTKLCHPATVAGQTLTLDAVTLEDGTSKTPATLYGDTLTITFTPLAVAQDALAGPCS